MENLREKLFGNFRLDCFINDEKNYVRIKWADQKFSN
jgi:hypothetical protein